MSDNVVGAYMLSDEDLDNGSEVWWTGYVTNGGAWYIVKYDRQAGTYRYTTGTKEYKENYSNKGNLSYNRWCEVKI